MEQNVTRQSYPFPDNLKKSQLANLFNINKKKQFLLSPAAFQKMCFLLGTSYIKSRK